jgi:intracellular septation protein
MKLLFDLFPVILFFAAFKYSEKNPETAASWVASCSARLRSTPKGANPARHRRRHRRHRRPDRLGAFPPRQGRQDAVGQPRAGRRLRRHDPGFPDESFIKWKPTILYWVFAGSMAFAALVLKKNPIKAMLGEQLTCRSRSGARSISRGSAFFVFMGALNLIIAFNFPTDTWVNFKLFGGMGLMLVFVLGQGCMLSKYVEEEK